MYVQTNLSTTTPELGPRDLSPHEALALRGQARLVDVREPAEWNGDLGHIDGAELVPLSTLSSVAVAWDREAPVVVLCRSGGRSGRARELLVAMGFSRVMNMAGGMLAYRQAGLPVSRS